MSKISQLDQQDLLDFMRFHITVGDNGTLKWRVDSEFGVAGQSAVRNPRVGEHSLRVAFGSEVFEASDLRSFIRTGVWPKKKKMKAMPHVVKVKYELLQQVYDLLPNGSVKNDVQDLLVRF